MRILLTIRLPNETFNAAVEFHVVMSPEELQQAGLDALGKKWG